MKPFLNRAARPVLALALVLCWLLDCRELRALTYDFNSYSFGNLNGQAGWGSEGFNGASGIQIIADSPSFGGTRFAWFNDLGTGRGASAWNMGGVAPALSGGSLVTLQFDFFAGTTQSNHVGLGWDNGTGKVTVNSAPSQLGLQIRADYNAGIEVFLNGSSLGTDTDAFTVNGFYTVRVTMDLAANGGAGLFSVGTMVHNASSFDPLTSLQNINLGLDSLGLSASDPALWNTLWFHHEGIAGMDNLIITAVPEPAPIALFGGGVVAMAMVIFKRRR